MTLVPKRGVLDITGYEGGRAEAPGSGRVFKLSSNESALGPSPKAMAAIRDAAVEAGVYPDGSARGLRDALAKLHGLDAERIVCGNGSDELLTLIANCYLCPNDEVLMSLHGFLVYKIVTLANSATPVEVPEPALKMDVEAVLARVTGRTRLVYIANPNNPTGSYLSAAELRRLHAGLPASVLLVIDAAYAEYVRRDDYESGMALASTADNVVMTRTFSKIFGLAGLRVGWAYCPLHVADTLNRVRGPFNVNVAAQRAAVAALGDLQHTDKSARHNEKWLSWLTRSIRELGLRADDSAANFVLIHFPDKSGPHALRAHHRVGGKAAGRAADADRFLMEKGVILRGVEAYNLPDCLRLTVGTEEANRVAIDALRAFMAS